MKSPSRNTVLTIKKIAFSLAAITLGLLLINASCALGERLAYGAFWGNDHPKGLYIHQKGERPKLAPGAKLNGWLYQININSLGFRGPDLIKNKPKNGLRIWCVGGSTTFDIYAPNDKRAWPAQTAAILNQRLPSRQVEAINAGVPGEILWGSTKDFQDHVKSIKPDYLIIYHGPNDIKQVASPPKQAAGAHNTQQQGEAGGIVQRLLSRTDIATIRVLRRWLQPLETIPSTWQNNQLTDPQTKDLRQRTEQLLRIARQRGVQPILATHALKAQPEDKGAIAQHRVAESTQLLSMTPENVIAAFEKYNAMIKSLAKEQNIPLADVRAAVGPESENWGDATHFKAAGSLIAAETMANAIINSSRPAKR